MTDLLGGLEPSLHKPNTLPALPGRKPPGIPKAVVPDPPRSPPIPHRRLPALRGLKPDRAVFGTPKYIYADEYHPGFHPRGTWVRFRSHSCLVRFLTIQATARVTCLDVDDSATAGWLYFNGRDILYCPKADGARSFSVDTDVKAGALSVRVQKP
jgi:hypothetical protein